MSHAFDPRAVDQLPEAIPIFPLPGATLLPRTQLPLNIFEPRYLNMIFDAMGQQRCIGMLQPCDDGTATGLYQVGCLGRITAYNETEDGRLLINLHGVCRFRVREELEPIRGYRRVRAGWQEFSADLEEHADFALDRAGFKEAMTGYFGEHGIRVDWEGLDRMPDERVVNFLAMHLPFSPQEKQALLEAHDVGTRYGVLMAVTSMAAGEDTDTTSMVRH